MIQQDKRKLPLFLAHCCLQTYKQFENDGPFTVPKGYKIISTFKAIALDEEEWFGFILESKRNIIIAFRGTESDPDWIVDAEVSQVPFPYSPSGFVHEGFLTIYESCREAIYNSMKQKVSHKPIIVTGHSLGGALATLCALDLSTVYTDVTCYTFASPRVGDPLFADSYNVNLKESNRYVNVFDIVPLLPPETIYCPYTDRTWQYKHVLKDHSFGLQTETLSGNHSIYTYIKGIYSLCK
ncbi:lipase family protein [Halalkalibacter akibai]|uniref:Lipase n=1 Tax=Halalkalibacter akibai (strain ATCC 43226 / DSM 21942 / CIP 109018 / JCM 9157 / 1139) TaxID=1236973 RepID=W4R0N4_HALA3|nr:lipase family protein [Halalkalibacter akibai]GAE37453.1 lipase [Halalkalibacter akibai JCM 9157]